MQTPTCVWTLLYLSADHIYLGIEIHHFWTGEMSAVKSTDCSSRGPEFNSQQPHGGSQPSVMRSDALFWCV
ncbi:rCG41153 [Rattus norvegicus]|uniref:RCG41153 n=1 Tax=Rattus norvegicus TaxID=10116 RepID=A6KIQ3_RAT|nr:rCG41153 [Rattus norvegicus]